ncbi:hypothetical protein B0T10DRAFT_198463 [Thelonectria olida]|uniref:DUF2264 domain-containing protein n=1 Tax=Thelonectria olida TaxID=1576542 RepID=A0A9P8VWB8_9HYPO|nr:hypothetical protein B0T10DRAFT_198463 [Thelonectria olida]
MPPLPGFSDNLFESRDDVVRAAEALIKPLMQYMSPGKGRVKIPQATGTHFDETAAQLEGFARPFWVIGALLMGRSSNMHLLQPWLDGLEAGTDPNHAEYWGPIKPFDQRMVEAEMISFSLLAAPREVLWERLSHQAQQNLINWLSGMHGKEMPQANWLWFRVFANLALLKVCQIDTPVVREHLRQDLECLDKFYIADGWSGDGLWRSPELDEQEFEIYKETGRANMIRSGRNACYYSGSFAIQFSQLLYIKFAGDLDPERTEKYRQQARDFGRGFCRFFDEAGAAIPFGRSLTYRFACGGFFAALAVADVPDLLEPLASRGAVKGFLLRHLRWWARHSENIFYSDGVLNLGWTYPQMSLTEDYNSPQSVYWALKSLIVVGLAQEDSFWRESEAPYPDSRRETALHVLPAPRQILCNHPDGNHHFMLSFAQFIGIPFKGVMAKYSKFAYSSSFGFSVPVGGHGLAQVAPDSMLALSRDGMETWAVKYKCAEPEFTMATVCGSVPQQVSAASVQWFPWADRCVSINTTIVPPTTRWPDWHIRIHRINIGSNLGKLFTAEGGFAIHGRHRKDTLELRPLELAELIAEFSVGEAEGIIETERSVLVLSEQGASGVSTSLLSEPHKTTVTPLKPEPNTNLMRQRTLIPTVEHDISRTDEKEVILVTKVFAISREANGGCRKQERSLQDRWLDEPVVRMQEETVPKDCIRVSY